MNHHHTFSCTLSYMLSLWSAKALITVLVISVFWWLDGADVRCLPPRCGRESGLQEPGSHNYPWRGKGPGVDLCSSNRKSVHGVLETGPLPLKKIMTVVYLRILMLAALSLYLLKRTYFRAPKTDNWQHQHSELSCSLSALFTVHSFETNWIIFPYHFVHSNLLFLHVCLIKVFKDSSQPAFSFLSHFIHQEYERVKTYGDLCKRGYIPVCGAHMFIGSSDYFLNTWLHQLVF